jgi:uncharacterized protein YbjT (DUF2867 family)
MSIKSILITGATGYLGGKLIESLVNSGYKLRCLVRNKTRLDKSFPESVEVIEGDVLKQDSLLPALKNIDTAYYLIHSMGTSTDFIEKDKIASRNFSEAAKAAGVKEII